jgi:putative spermidine/putrescine transport system substrate-binding protein
MLFYRRIVRRFSFLFSLLIVMGLVLSACQPAATPTPPSPPTSAPAAQATTAPQPTAVPQPTEPPAAMGGPLQSIGAGEGAVSIVAWAGYIERGESDPAYDWVTQFEKDTGCMVSVKVANTSDEMVALMNEGGFDLVTASGDASNRLISGGTVQEVNINLIPSWSKVDPRLQNAPWHTVDGKHYGVPYQWGPNVLMYNTKAFGDQAPTSWGVVFQEQTLADGQSNKGRVSAYDGPIYIADAALYLMTHNPELGIKDPCCANSASWSSATGTMPTFRSMTSPRRASSRRARGRSR